MSNYDRQYPTDMAEDLSRDIEKAYGRYGVNIEIKGGDIKEDRIIFEVKPKRDTRESQVIARAADVQLRLKLPLFHVFNENFTIFIAASPSAVKYDDLPKILASPEYLEAKKKMKLPYVVGHKVTGELIIADLLTEKHLLMGGATGSGKSVALKSLILSIITGKSVSKVNMLLIDVGANDLMPFDGIPHLSCPLIRDMEESLRALLALNEESERRKELEISNPDEFNMLPRIVCIIDEFPVLISGMGDRELSKLLAVTMSNLLNRGRHTKIHMVLAAQNPTLQNIKVDLGNITARMAFKCAKRNFSETIIGEGGAEHLAGEGDMYFKSLQHGLLRIQGAFISPNELKRSLSNLKRPLYYSNDHKFILPDVEMHGAASSYKPIRIPATTKQEVDDMLFAEILIWVLKHKEISCNSLMKKFRISWNRANGYLERLNELAIVGDVFSTLPRVVYTEAHDDLSYEVMDFLVRQGYTVSDIAEALNSKDSGR